MLVLSRRPHEKIILDNGVEITVVSIKGQCVRLGVDAPKNVRIIREELAPFRDVPLDDQEPEPRREMLPGIRDE